MHKRFLILMISLSFVVCVFQGASAEDSRIRNLIVAYTTGTISRHDTIKVQFDRDTVPEERVGQRLSSSTFRFDPSIRGEAVWSNRRLLVFRPESPLEAGQIYSVTLDLSAASSQPDSGEFAFDLDVMERDFDVRFEGFSAGRNERTLLLTGTIHTADREPAGDVEAMLTSSQEKRSLRIHWEHEKLDKQHLFTIAGIQRSAEASKLTMRWNGRSIGVDRGADKTLEVPPLGRFRVLDVRPVSGLTRYIDIRFSDPLLPDQDLSGLISVVSGMDTSTTEIIGNRAKVYMDGRPSGKTTLSVYSGIKNAYGKRLEESSEYVVSFGDMKPSVRFVGDRTIVPSTPGLTLPFETANLKAVVVQADRIYEDNIPQYLQINTLKGGAQLNRVGRTVLRRVLPLQFQDDQKDRWVRHGLDVGDLVRDAPGSIYRITVSFLPHHIVYDCSGLTDDPIPAEDLPTDNWTDMVESSFWDNLGTGGTVSWSDLYRNRNNPCHPGYFRANGPKKHIKASRNILVSDIGLIAKMGSENRVNVAVTNIRTARPLPGVSLELLDYQQQTLAKALSDYRGMAVMDAERDPFLLIARRHAPEGTRFGYLPLADGSALSVSHFDVAGQKVREGLKGYIYGERGVWRPGDPIYLTFVLQDLQGRLPPDHPVIFELYNPRGQREVRLVKTEGFSGFYAIRTRTARDAPTGDWLAKVKVGGAVFTKKLKVETVKPNRLKVRLSFGEETPFLTPGLIEGDLTAQWLHGATAKDLAADVKMHLTERKTGFPAHEEYSFDDPVRTYDTERHTLFDGKLDETGAAYFVESVTVKNASPGMLTAHFETRVFEPGGGFSIDRTSMPFHPYDRYVGVRTPPGDKARGMLQTNQKHTVQLVLVDAEGKPIDRGKVDVVLYKIRWRWWWEKEREQFADFTSSNAYRVIKEGSARIENGKGEWNFEIKYPDWGRYLIRVSDAEGRHRAGRIVYVDWPGWAGKGRKDMPGAATVLAFSAEKSEYAVGETVAVDLPLGSVGRALVSVENGSRVLKSDWIEGSDKPVRHTFAATREMVPNVYIHVTYLQPHSQTLNDLPIRMYGVVPVKITDSATILAPAIKAPATFSPESTGTVSVSEKDGRAMTYTLAVVDEGLLDLTRFATPNPWDHFYRREALGVQTWDLYDMVAGAYGGVLEQLLAIGGGLAKGSEAGKKAQRFPPMVRFYGPFDLAAGKTAEHSIDIPLYVGSVRTMVVAGRDGAYGAAEARVYVRKPLMILGTLPRTLGTGESVDLPVSVFAMEPSVKSVVVTVAADGPLQTVGDAARNVTFTRPGDEIVSFSMGAGRRPGVSLVTVSAQGDGHTARHEIEIDVQVPSSPITEDVSAVIEPGDSWQRTVELPGLAGTNQAVLEASRIPPLNLEERLNYLIHYPHGCVEQIVSGVFPQLFLDRLVDLNLERRSEVQSNIRAGIRRLRKFQQPEGGFSFWAHAGSPHDWATSYAGHFLLEARQRGYKVPEDMLKNWKQYQRGAADEGSRRTEQAKLAQAYRLYTLALAGSPDLGAMNRLREARRLGMAARWRLAAAYVMAGKPEAAAGIVASGAWDVPEYREFSGTFGSHVRDKAMILETLYLMGRMEDAVALVREISSELSSSSWLSTQTTAFALLVLGKIAGDMDFGGDGEMQFSYSWGSDESRQVTGRKPITRIELATGDSTGGTITVDNAGSRMLYARLIMTGQPEPGWERTASKGLEIGVEYTTLKGNPIDVTRLEQGTDFLASVTLKNRSYKTVKEIALSQLFPSGWEIRNTRLSGDVRREAKYNYRDVRDDRVYTYFNIQTFVPKTFIIQLTAAYRGRYYLPMVSAEAMYDATVNGRIAGQWVQVVAQGEEKETDGPSAPGEDENEDSPESQPGKAETGLSNED